MDICPTLGTFQDSGGIIIDLLMMKITEDNYKKSINERIESIVGALPQDLTIISGGNEEIQTNKYLLSLFSPDLFPLLSSSSFCTTPTLFLPDCSTSSINNLIDIIKDGFIFTDNLYLEGLLEIVEAGKLLFVEDMILIEAEKTAKQKLMCNQINIEQEERKWTPKISFNEILHGFNELLDENEIIQDFTNPPNHQRFVQNSINITVNDYNITEERLKRKRTSEGQEQKSLFSCEQCQYQASQMSTLNRHVKMKHAESQYKCQQCEHSVETEPGLKRHVKSKHDKIRYYCDQCDFKATQKVLLQRHVEEVHKGLRYSCNQCEYKAIQRAQLKTHETSVHEGVRYSCNKCEYQAIQKVLLQGHVESVHEGVRYPCDQCEFKSTQKALLQRHVESIHEGVQYPCNQCEYEARRKDHLIAHVKSRHASD